MNITLVEGWRGGGVEGWRLEVMASEFRKRLYSPYIPDQ
jgi:hypothetical protein